MSKGHMLKYILMQGCSQQSQNRKSETLQSETFGKDVNGSNAKLN
jgi:hypothetical protein